MLKIGDNLIWYGTLCTLTRSVVNIGCCYVIEYLWSTRVCREKFKLVSPSHVLLQFSPIWYIAQWNIVVQIVPFPELFYTLLWNPLKHQTTPLIIEVHFDPWKYESYEFADCTILGDFAYISNLCLFIYLWKKHPKKFRSVFNR